MMKNTRLLAALIVATAAATGCAGDRRTDQADATPAKSVASKPAAAQPALPQTQRIVIPAGTNIVASLQTPLATDVNHTGDSFVASTIVPVVVDGRTVIATGSRIRGVLRDVKDSGRIKGRASMTLAFEEFVDSDGKSHAISATPLTVQAASETSSDVEKIAAGGILGAVIGGIADGSKGAGKGAVIGAGAGTILMLATKGDDVELNAGQRLNIHITSPVDLTLLAQR